MQPDTVTKTAYAELLLMVRGTRLESKAIDLRDRHNKLQWDAGDITNQVYALAVANKIEATKMDVCWFVSQEYLDGVYSTNTLRVYSAVSDFFPPKARAKYGVLPYSHFRVAAGMGTEWESVLTASLEYFEEYGYFLSGERLKAKFNPIYEVSPVGGVSGGESEINPNLPVDFNSHKALEVVVASESDIPELEALLHALEARLQRYSRFPLIGTQVAQVVCLCRTIIDEIRA